MLTSAMFITFEGPEGSGKTTQIVALAEWLRAQGLMVLTTREPGGTAIGNRVREILLDPIATEMAPTTEALLFAAARAQLVGEIIRPHLAQGVVVICDRYADSTLAYQGYGHRLDIPQVRTLLQFATGGLAPDLTVYLDVDVQMGLRRKQEQAAVASQRGADAPGASSQWNRMERKTVAYHQRVREGYLAMAASEPERWQVIDAGLPLEDVQALVRHRVAAILGARLVEES